MLEQVKTPTKEQEEELKKKWVEFEGIERNYRKWRDLTDLFRKQFQWLGRDNRDEEPIDPQIMDLLVDMVKASLALTGGYSKAFLAVLTYYDFYEPVSAQTQVGVTATQEQINRLNATLVPFEMDPITAETQLWDLLKIRSILIKAILLEEGRAFEKAFRALFKPLLTKLLDDSLNEEAFTDRRKVFRMLSRSHRKMVDAEKEMNVFYDKLKSMSKEIHGY